MVHKITSVDYQKNFGRYHDIALREPVIITKHGRDSVALISADELKRLMRRDRKALLIEELSESTIQAISQAEVPTEYGYLDKELDDR